ncbi:MAG: VWA domain-containing protein [Pseudomonadales bacterium]|nr:VWA domain-containing protein [Pseudomonadales bacterium]
MLTLAHPLVLALLPLPLLVYLLASPYRQTRPAVRAPFFDRLLRATGNDATHAPPIGQRPVRRWALLILSWLLVVGALARPTWLEDPVVRELPMRDLLVALDLSGSMETKDFADETGAVLDRLSAAQQVLDAFLARRDGDRVGLVFFGTAAFVQAPLTEDLPVVRQLLEEAAVRMLGPRTAIGDAMGLAIHLFERSEVEERVLILLTDGNDTGSLVPPTRAAEIARDNGVVVHTIAMGDATAAGEQALDERTLQSVAATTGGGYFRAMDRDALEAVYARIDELNPRQVETLSYRPERDLHAWPIGALLLLTLGAFGVRELVRAVRPKGGVEPAGTLGPARGRASGV